MSVDFSGEDSPESFFDQRSRILKTEVVATSQAPPEHPELIAPGTHLGKYEIVHRIAYGGMAEIYLARAAGIHGFEKYVVLKRILPQYADDEEFVRMFLKEARVAATLDHANIAHVYDIGQTGGVYFFTMEYLHGEDLRWIMRELHRRGSVPPLEHAVAAAIGAAAGLHFAHERKGPDGRLLGIVHRDISPSNVVVTYDGSVKLVDFGVAKITADPDLSRRYSLKGKLAYMSPEQLHNRPVDRRSDLFSLGVVLYEITTGARLFKGTTEVETMRMVLEHVVSPPTVIRPGYPAELERIVMRALEADPDQRYETARDLQLDLEAFARDQKLQVSSAALGAWMEATFGPKRELWHTLPPPAAATEGAPAAPREPTAVTSREADSDSRAATAAAGSGRRRAGARSGPLRVAVAALVVVLAGAGVALWKANQRPVASDTPAPMPVLLVAEQGHVAVEHGAAVPASPPAAAEPPPTPALQEPGQEPVQKAIKEPPGRRRRARGSSAARATAATRDGFSASFARREGEISGCFGGGPEATPRAGEISLRFEVGRDGSVTSVIVLPAAVAATPLGACLARVGRATTFPPQPTPITFRIPLTVQLRSGARTHR
jgi:serine/threonine protein kinase